jgi:hypothetical protein
MGIDLPKAGASSGSSQLGHPAGAERAMRRLDPYEYRPPVGRCRTAAKQIRSDRLTDVPGQWQTFVTICFAMHHDLAGSPIDVVERKLGDFGRPQAETDQHGQDREVAAAIQGAVVAGCQKAPDLIGIQSFWAVRPIADRRRMARQRRATARLCLRHEESRAVTGERLRFASRHYGPDWGSDSPRRRRRRPWSVAQGPGRGHRARSCRKEIDAPHRDNRGRFGPPSHAQPSDSFGIAPPPLLLDRWVLAAAVWESFRDRTDKRVSAASL